MNTLASQVAELRRRGCIVTAPLSSGPVIVGHIEGNLSDVTDFFEAALARAYAQNEKRIVNAPPFLRGRDERVMPRDSFGRIKSKAAGGRR